MLNSTISQKLYFHGSKSKRITKFSAPSTRYPFYVTSDLHYAMAFATKATSSVGGDRTIEFGIEEYVYVFTLNENAKLFNFIDDVSNQYKILSTIIPRKILNIIIDYTNSNTTDIYEFGNALLEFMWPIKVNLKTSQCTQQFIDNSNVLFDFYDNNELDKYIDSDGETHSMLHFIFDKLQMHGFDGVITSEEDHDVYSNVVTTNNAIGIWNINALDVCSNVPMKRKFCEKINKSYCKNSTDSTAIMKIHQFISIYNKIRKQQQ